MQIKCFEADDMTDALRMVKREFGDEAVILSAKEVKPSGFFSALKKKHVAITAATDFPVDDAGHANEFNAMLARQLDDEASGDRVSLSIPAQSNRIFKPEKQLAGQTRLPIEKDSLAHETGLGQMPQRPTPVRSPSTITKCRSADTLCIDGVAAATKHTQTPDVDPWVAEPFYTTSKKRKVIAMVGPPGAGKSTSVAKLAWHCRMVEKQRIGLVSLDRFRIAANSLLESVAPIMDLSLSVVRDADGLQTVMADLDDVDVVLIDTPGIGRMETSMMEEVGGLLRLADPNETHLVVNATVHEDVIAATVEAFSSVGPNRLLVTHMDECVGKQMGLNQLQHTRLSASFYADGTDLTEALKVTAGQCPATLVPEAPSATGQVTAFPGNKMHQHVEPIDFSDAVGPVQYLANRNSELFHHASCKSVKRINAENIAAFDSIEQAINAGFKPCRACCKVGMIKKAAMVNTSYRRVGAM